MPEAGGDVVHCPGPVRIAEDVIETLIGGTLIQRAAGRAERPDFHIIEEFPYIFLHTFPAGVDSEFKRRIGAADIGGGGHQSVVVIALAQEEEAVNAKVFGNKGINGFRSKFHTHVTP